MPTHGTGPGNCIQIGDISFACDDLGPKKRFVVYLGTERFSLGGKIEAIGWVALATELRAAK